MKLKLNFIESATVGVLTIAAFIVGCQKPDYPDPTPMTTPSTALARFNFVDVSPDAPAVNFYLENIQAGQTQSFSAVPVSASYVTGQAGGGGVQLRAKAASGTLGGVIGSNDVLYRSSTTNQNNFAAVAGNNYTVFLTDTLNRPKPVLTGAVGTNLGGPQFLVVTDTLTAPPAGTARVRFFNLAPDVSAASARLTNATSTTSVTNLTNRAYRATPAAYTRLPAGPYVTQVYSGTSIAATATPIASTTLTLTDGKIYTIYAQGLNRKKTVSVGTVQHN